FGERKELRHEYARVLDKDLAIPRFEIGIPRNTSVFALAMNQIVQLARVLPYRRRLPAEGAARTIPAPVLLLTLPVGLQRLASGKETSGIDDGRIGKPAFDVLDVAYTLFDTHDP